MDKPLVSVIIPAFNAEGTIRQTLESVSAQTYRAIEVIVVDDGSSDRTTAIVEEFTANDSNFSSSVSQTLELEPPEIPELAKRGANTLHRWMPMICGCPRRWRSRSPV